MFAIYPSLDPERPITISAGGKEHTATIEEVEDLIHRLQMAAEKAKEKKQ